MDMRRMRYGLRSKIEHAVWQYQIAGPFETAEEAKAWLEAQEMGTWKRQVVSKNRLIELVGKREYNAYMKYLETGDKSGWNYQHR